MKINLYKIEKITLNNEDNTYNNLVVKLKAKNYFIESSITVERITYELFINSKDRESINWLDELNKVFDSTELKIDYGKIYNAVLIVKSVQNNIYALSFGHSFHVLQQLCDLNFALDFAESQLITENIDTKSSDFLQGTKIKELTNVKRDTIATREGGENYKFVSGIPVDSIFGKRIECGFSIQSSKEINLEELADLNKIAKLIVEVERSISKNIKPNTFPRIRYLSRSNSENSRLDNKLLNTLKDNTTEFEVYTSTFDVIGSSIFMYSTEYSYEMYCKNYKNNTLEVNEYLNKEILLECISRYSDYINHLDDVLVVLHKEDETSIPQSIKRFLFAVIDEEEEKLIFTDSRWGKVNRTFLDELDTNLINIQNNNLIIGNPDFTQEYSNEDDYINKLISSGAFLQLHKKLIFINGTKFELADLFNLSSNELYAIKLGKSNQDFIYSFDQNNSATKCLTNHKDYNLIEQLDKHGFSSNEIENIIDSKTYSVVLGFEQSTYKTRIRNGTFKLVDLQSLLLKLKIASWSNFMASTGLNYKLYVIEGNKNNS